MKYNQVRIHAIEKANLICRSTILPHYSPCKITKPIHCKPPEKNLPVKFSRIEII